MIETRVEGKIGWVILNRPEKLNAINLEGWRRLGEALSEAASDQSISAVILTGVGRAFSAGDDIKMMGEAVSAEENIEMFHVMWRAVDAFLNLEKPVVAAVNGLAYGGGFEITLLCDYVIASEQARFSLPEVRLGAYPPIATALLPLFVGLRRAYELILLGKTLDASEAAEWGLVDRVVPGNVLREEARRVAEKLSELPPHSVRIVKRVTSNLIYMLGVRDLQSLLALLSQTKAYRLGVKRFLERRR